MTKNELWKKFMKTGRISDYLAYQRAKDAAMPEEPFSEELAQEFVQNFDVDFPDMQITQRTAESEELFDEDDPS